MRNRRTYGYWSVPIGADDAIDFTLCAELFWCESPGHDGEDIVVVVAVVAAVVVGSGRHGERTSQGRQMKREGELCWWLSSSTAGG